MGGVLCEFNWKFSMLFNYGQFLVDEIYGRDPLLTKGTTLSIEALYEFNYNLGIYVSLFKYLLSIKSANSKLLSSSLIYL